MFMRTLLCFSLFSYIFVMIYFLLIIHTPLFFFHLRRITQENKTTAATKGKFIRGTPDKRSTKTTMLQETILGAIHRSPLDQPRQEVVALLRRQLQRRLDLPSSYSAIHHPDLDHGTVGPLPWNYGRWYWTRRRWPRHCRPLGATDNQLVVVAPEVVDHSGSRRSLTTGGKPRR